VHGDIKPAPDDHLTAGPHRGVRYSGRWRVGGAGASPTVCAWIISPAGIQEAAVIAGPDDHLAAGPHCRVNVSGSGRVCGAGSCPTVRAGIVSPAGVKKIVVISTP